MMRLAYYLVYCTVWLFFFGCSQKVYPDRTQFLPDGAVTPTVDLAAYRSVQLRAGQDSSLAVALCISGGGARAANFGTGIMLGLEEVANGQNRNALQEVDYLSTVSGGGFAGGAYITALYEHAYYRRPQPFSFVEYVDRQIRDDLARSYMWPLIRANFNIFLLFTPIDDGDALEKAVDNYVMGYVRRRGDDGGRSIVLGDMFIPATSRRRPTLPYHITNSATVKGIRIFPFTPDILQTYQIDGYSHRMRREYLGEAFNPYAVPHSVGIKSSGSFPVLISNTTLRSTYHPERPYLHLMDGALSDNLGVYTGIDILKQDKASRKALWVIDAENDNNYYTFSKHQSSVWSVKVLASLPGSGLYANRGILSQEFRDMTEPFGIELVYFGFSVLLWDNDAQPPATINLKEAYPYLINRLRRTPHTLSDVDKQMLYEVLSQIATKYTIKDEEQELLFLAGRLIVHLQKDAVLTSLQKG